MDNAMSENGQRTDDFPCRISGNFHRPFPLCRRAHRTPSVLRLLSVYGSLCAFVKSASVY